MGITAIWAAQCRTSTAEGISTTTIDLMNYYIIETDFRAVQIMTDKAFNLQTDGRTKQGKMRKKYFEAINILSQIAWELDCNIEDISPVS